MKVSVHAFKLDFKKGINGNTLVKFIKRKQGKEFEFKGAKRVLFMDEKDSFHTGLLLTIRDNKSLVQLQKERNEINISVLEIEKDKWMFDFNAFIIHKASSRGLYMQYRGSCTINQFGVFLSDSYAELRKKAVTHKIEEGYSPAEAEKLVSPRLGWDVVYRKNDFEEAMKELSYIGSVGISAAVPKILDANGKPLPRLVRFQKHQISFDKKAPKNEAEKHVRELFKNLKPRRAKVSGVNLDGVETVYRLYNFPSKFGEYDFDELTGYMNFKAHEFNDSTIIERLIEISVKQKAILEFPEE